MLLPIGVRYCSNHLHHLRPAWITRTSVPQRIRGRALQILRAIQFAKKPLCERCEQRGLVTSATQRDHIVPLAEGGTEDEDNIQSLCDACHLEKSKLESQRGRRRGGTENSRRSRW